MKWLSVLFRIIKILTTIISTNLMILNGWWILSSLKFNQIPQICCLGQTESLEQQNKPGISRDDWQIMIPSSVCWWITYTRNRRERGRRSLPVSCSSLLSPPRSFAIEMEFQVQREDLSYIRLCVWHQSMHVSIWTHQSMHVANICTHQSMHVVN